MSQEKGLEIRVGAFVLAAAIALTFFVISISGLSFLEKGRHFEVVFGFASGLGEASPVRLAGVEVGLVKGLKVFVDQDGRTKVKVNLLIKDNIPIAADSRITINQLGILGEKYIEIMPGHSNQPLADNSVITGEDPVPIEKITEHVDSLMTKLDTTIDGINNGILTEENKKSLAQAMQGFAALGTDLKEGRGTLGKLLTDDSIYDNLDELSSDLKSNPWKLLYRPQPKR